MPHLSVSLAHFTPMLFLKLNNLRLNVLQVLTPE